MACQLDTNRKTLTVMWLLENFEFCSQKTEEELKGPTFIVDALARTKWSLSIYPRGEDSELWISTFLNREVDSKGPLTIEVGFEIAFLSSDFSILESDVVNKYAFLKGEGYGFSDFVKREFIITNQSKFITQGALMIRCRMWKSTGDITTDSQYFARTLIGVERKVFLWKIKDFSTFDIDQEKTFRLKSTVDDKPIITLKIFLRNNRSWPAIIIKFVNFKRGTVFSTFKSSLVDARGEYVNFGKHEFWISSASQIEEYTLPLSKGALIGNKNLYLPNDILTLFCECALSPGVVFEGIEATTSGCSNYFTKKNLIPQITHDATVEKLDWSISSDLKTDLRFILKDNILCDVKLCTESETFPAHWIILSARSPVFRAMFKSDMKERAKDRIDIEDLKPDTVRRMLVYIYTDSLEELNWETASDLYVVAEKYQIISLKDKCSSFLTTNLSLTNACILLLADLHQDKELKSTVQNFILENDKSIINSKEWKLLMETNVNLAAETMVLKYK